MVTGLPAVGKSFVVTPMVPVRGSVMAIFTLTVS